MRLNIKELEGYGISVVVKRKGKYEDGEPETIEFYGSNGPTEHDQEAMKTFLHDFGFTDREEDNLADEIYNARFSALVRSKIR